MISSGNWVKYQTYTGHFPSYVYSVTLNAGDRLKAVLSWPDNVDLDLYLYSDGMNLLSRNIWVDQ